MIEPMVRYEGTVARLMGDAVLAFFGAPIAHEDDPERACRAALDIVEGAQRYAEELERKRGIRGFNVRVGINTGLVVVGEVGSDLRVEYTAMGDAINLAARMEQNAPSGGILITHDTYRHVRGVFDVRPGITGLAQVNGINPSWHRIENRSVIVGRPFTLMDEEHGWQVCLITPDVRDELRLPRDCIGKRIVIDRRSFEIVGVVEGRVESGMFGNMGSSKEVFIPFETAWRLWDPWIYAMASCRKPELSKEAQAELRFFLRQARRLGPGDPDTFRLEVIEEYLKTFNKMAMAITAVAGGVVGISLLVGGVGIMNIMLVSVSERTREIGLRKAVGAKPSAILLQFLVESIVLCLFGGLIGAAVGQFMTSMIAKIPNANLDMAYIPLWDIGLSFGFAATVGVFFGMFPAIKAARLDPIEALRHE